MKPPVYAIVLELPPPRAGMIRRAIASFVADVLAAGIAVAAVLALMIDG